MKPRGSWIFVTRDENELKLNESSLILLPEERHFDNPCVTVVAAGPGGVKNGYKEFMDVNPGDKLVVDNIWTDSKNKINGTEMFNIDIESVECIVEFIEDGKEEITVKLD